ncbi:maleylpyruvate isomerase family mycothiol-dependent enzyme [Allokutzneria oryzae]|uniref:Maleylpyruvate isomerase family mycothiol-dependent enzyme n=1 Tax=Allokutzneria oryzae TaxID=1378989 RepID=A0ABV6A736_9PSEU
MGLVGEFQREVLAFEAAVRVGARAETAPVVPSCPQWTLTDLVLHLGFVHRLVSWIFEEGLQQAPDLSDIRFLRRHEGSWEGWPRLENAPNHGPVPDGLADWFGEGATALLHAFEECEQDSPVWTWTADRTTGFWLRMQVTEAAVHRWDAENAVGTARPMAPELAARAIVHHFEVLAPAWRAQFPSVAGGGERFRFRPTDHDTGWTVEFDGDEIRLTEGPGDIELGGSLSELMLFLWGRVPADRLDVRGDRDVLDRYGSFVPEV